MVIGKCYIFYVVLKKKKKEISNKKNMPEVESPNIVQSFVGRNPCI